MIHHVRGLIFEKNPMNVVIETSGIGFDLRIPLSSFEALPAVGENCLLYTHLYNSQDESKLFGFVTKAERELFLLLISVSGIGPRIALSVLSTLTIETFVKALLRGEEAIISRVPGLGKKTAQRLIVELRDKVPQLSDNTTAEAFTLSDHNLFEVETALVSLGFASKDIRRELSTLSEEALKLSTEQIIKETIRRIYQKK
ncbi:MAG: Holliday junction branch migration protein RuvA [Candidatus Cloacimonetes bacterium]|nr:Holliday junction branch migration protein RuvA [Candidatus Cloacimonadota bacterium]